MTPIRSGMMACIAFTLSSIFAAHSYGQILSVNLQASGLTCSMCSRAIYKSLMKIPSVGKIEEDIQHSSFTILFKDHAKIVLDDLKKAVKDAGFSVASVEIRADLGHVEVANDTRLSLNDIPFSFVGIPRQVLQGQQKLVLVDKDFLPEKERQKYAHMMEGKPLNPGGGGERIYHVTIRQS